MVSTARTTPAPLPVGSARNQGPGESAGAPAVRAAGRRPLTTAECRSRLRHHHEGRIGYLSGRGWRQVVVSYAATPDAVLIRLPDCNEAVHYAPDQPVTFDVCDAGDDGRGHDEITILGTAALAAGPVAAAAFEEPAWPGTAMQVLSVDIGDISGFTENG